jgi:hypothetical protein
VVSVVPLEKSRCGKYLVPEKRSMGKLRGSTMVRAEGARDGVDRATSIAGIMNIDNAGHWNYSRPVIAIVGNKGLQDKKVGNGRRLRLGFHIYTSVLYGAIG